MTGLQIRVCFILLLSLSTTVFSGCRQKRDFGIKSALDNSPTTNEELFLIVQNDKWGYINKNGQIVIEPQFSDGREFSEGLAAIAFGEYPHKKHGYINAAGQLVIEAAFEDAYSFSEGLALICLKGKYGFIDTNGKIVIDPQFGFSQSFSEGFAQVTSQTMRIGSIRLTTTKTFYIDKKGNRLGEMTFNDGRSFSGGCASVSIHGKSGSIDKTGEFIIEPRYDWIESFSEGLAATKIGDKWGYIDKSGEFVISPQYDAADPFSEGLAAVKINNRFRFIDKTGKEVIQTPFRFVGEFSEGRAKVQDDNGYYGYIDKQGDVIIPPQFFPLVEDFTHGFALVQIPDGDFQKTLQSKYGYIDKQGKYMWSPKK